MSATWGDLATVLRLLAANQRRLTEMMRRIWHDDYGPILANLATVEALLDPGPVTATPPADDPHELHRWEGEGGAVVAPEVTIPDPTVGRERHS